MMVVVFFCWFDIIGSMTALHKTLSVPVFYDLFFCICYLRKELVLGKTVKVDAGRI